MAERLALAFVRRNGWRMSALDRIRAVTFDVGGTLLEPWPSVGHVYAQVAAECGVSNVDPAEANRQFHAAWSAQPQFDHSRAAWAALVAASLADFCDRKTCAAIFPRLYDRFAQRHAWRMFPDVRPTLQGLHTRGLKLGVISNWDERLCPLLDQFDLTPLFSAILVSRQVGFRKPSPRIFAQAAARLGFSPGLILHVGDSAVDDAEGARQAGFAALWLRRHASERRSDQVATLTDLLERLG